MDYLLPPLIHPHIDNLLQNHTQELDKLLGLFGLPIYIVFPQIMRSTVDRSRQTLDNSVISESQIYFTAKANKANALLTVCATNGIGVDADLFAESETNAI